MRWENGKMPNIRIRNILGMCAVCLVVGFFAGDRLRASINRESIDKITTELNAERERNRELETINRDSREAIERITRQYNSVVNELGAVKTTLDGITRSLSGDIQSISDIIDRIREIRAAIKEYQDNSGIADGPGVN